MENISWMEALAQVAGRSLRRGNAFPPGPGNRLNWTSNQVFFFFVVASVPTALVGVWNLGAQILLHAGPGFALADLGWRGITLQALGVQADTTAWWAAMLLGLSYLLPLLLVALAVCAFWMAAFLRWRGNCADASWIMTAWLFVLLLPPGVSPGFAALGISFGVIVGAHIFGGTGRYLVSPALLGVLFLHFSYPGFVQAALPLPGVELPTSWLQMVGSAGSSPSLVDLALGRELGALGTGAALACAAGLVYLLYTGAASWRIAAGAVAGVLAVSLIVASLTTANAAAALPWYTHLVAGNFAFVVAFVATDPSAAPLTRAGRWYFGGLLGALTVAIRVLDPSHPEGSLFAVLLAALAVPLIDYAVIRRFARPAQGLPLS